MSSATMLAAATRQGLLCLRVTAALIWPNQCSPLAGKRILLPVLASLGLCLGACTGEPSESEITEALNRMVSQIYDTAAARKRPIQIPMPMMSARKIDCKKAENQEGHVCTFEPFVNGEAKPREKGRFYKEANGVLTYSQF